MQVQINYNRHHSSQRSVVERAIGLLKGKWRRLKFVDVTNIDLIPNIVASSCVLHNFVLDVEGDVLEDDFYLSDEEEESDEDDFEDDHHMHDDARLKRDRIANSLY